MKTTAVLAPNLPLAAQSSLAARLPYFLTLMKPRVMALAVFTAFVGMMVAPGRIDPILGLRCNSRDRRGSRCRRRAQHVVRRRYRCRDDSHGQAANSSRQDLTRRSVGFRACSFRWGASPSLRSLPTSKAAALLAFAVFFYVAVYTMWLKRQTPQNIVIGGAAGALPPVIGWAAATGDVGLEPLILFLIIFLWTPPHFWALSLNRVRRICPCGRPHAAGRCWKECNREADLRLQPSSAAGFNTTLGARVCRRSLRRGCRRRWCDLCCARGSSTQKAWDQSARSASLVRILHFVPVSVFCRVAGQQHQPINNGALRARRLDCRDIAGHFPSGPASNDARSIPGQRRRGLACGTFSYVPS